MEPINKQKSSPAAAFPLTSLGYICTVSAWQKKRKNKRTLLAVEHVLTTRYLITASMFLSAEWWSAMTIPFTSFSFFLSFFFSLFFFFFFVQLDSADGISPVGNSGVFSGESQLRQSRATQPACWVFQCFRNLPNSDMDYRIFNVRNVRTAVNVFDCTRGCTDTVRESALKVD